jgi:hypothetical protein
VSTIDHLAHASLPQAAAEEWEGAVELVAAGTNRVVARIVTSLRVLVLTATLAVEHGGTLHPKMPSQTGDMVRGKHSKAVDEVEGTTDTHRHGKAHVTVACAPFTALRVVAFRVTIAHFCTSRKGVRHNTVVKARLLPAHVIATQPLHVVRGSVSVLSQSVGGAWHHKRKLNLLNKV